MPVRNQNWYNLQSTRRYPLDDASTGVDDAGDSIRDDILVDCHIRFPAAFGEFLYVQGVTVSANFVTVLFGADGNLITTTGVTVAAVSVTKPVATNVHIAITPLQPGVSGWVVFGPGIDNNFVGRYTTPAQTLINRRNARKYDSLPIPSLGKINLNSSLAGLIKITAAAPVTARYLDEYTLPEEQRLQKYDPEEEVEEKKTNTDPVRAIVFSTETPTAVSNPLSEFLGPCGQRPETENCPKKPIESINGIKPDCTTGNIDIVLENGLTARMFEECGGVDITTLRGLTEACAQDSKAEKVRKDECCEGDDALAEYCWPAPQKDDGVCENTAAPCPPLPLCVTFAECTVPLFDIKSGRFALQDINAPQVCCPREESGRRFSQHSAWYTDGITRAIALYRGCASDWAYDHTIAVEVMPFSQQGSSGGFKYNGGVVINYTTVQENGRCKTKYVAVVVNAGSGFPAVGGSILVYRFNGRTLIEEANIEADIFPDNWYKIEVTASSGANETELLIQLSAINPTNSLFVSLGYYTVSISDYEIVNGQFGVISFNGVAFFNNFTVTPKFAVTPRIIINEDDNILPNAEVVQQIGVTLRTVGLPGALFTYALEEGEGDDDNAKFMISSERLYLLSKNSVTPGDELSLRISSTSVVSSETITKIFRVYVSGTTVARDIKFVTGSIFSQNLPPSKIINDGVLMQTIGVPGDIFTYEVIPSADGTISDFYVVGDRLYAYSSIGSGDFYVVIKSTSDIPDEYFVKIVLIRIS